MLKAVCNENVTAQRMKAFFTNDFLRIDFINARMRAVGGDFFRKNLVPKKHEFSDSADDDSTLSSFIIINLTGIVINFTRTKIPVNFKAVSTISAGRQRFDINP